MRTKKTKDASWRGHAFVLVPRPITDKLSDDYQLMHGRLQIGRIYKRKAEPAPEI
jgi:hypothetical protein